MQVGTVRGIQANVLGSPRDLPRVFAAILLATLLLGASGSAARAVTAPTPTSTIVGGRVTGPDGVLVKGSADISAPDANFTSADLGFGIHGMGVPAGSTIIAIISPTSATISAAATRNLTTDVFSISGASAALYGWGDATMPDGSIIVGDYWNYRIVHFNADGTQASPYVFTKSTLGFGPNTNQAPFGICVDNSSGPFHRYVYMTEGSLYNVVQYDPNGNWVTSWGTTNASHSVAFLYPSQCAVDPLTGLVYISNQWGKSIVVLDPTTNIATFVSPPSPNTFIQPRGLAFDSADNIWIADEGHRRVDIYKPSCLQSPWPATGCAAIKTLLPPIGVSTTFDMRGLAIDTTSTPNLAFVVNGENCLVQEFNADPGPTGTYPAITKANNYGFVLNFNNVASGTSNCGTRDQLGQNGQFEDGARGVAVDSNHHVWAGDLADFRTQIFDESGNWVNNVPAYWPNGTSPNAPSLPPVGGFNGPRGAAFDPSGNLYVTDMFNERIEEFAPNGVTGGFDFVQTWGMRGDTAIQFNYPRLMCWDSSTSVGGGGSGALIVANTDSNEIVAWNPQAGGGPAVVWSQQSLADPYGVACDPSTGLIYVANSNGKDVVVLNADGSVAGTIGAGKITAFSRGIAVDPVDGSVWVDASTKVYHFGSWASGGTLITSFVASSGGSGSCNPFGLALTANFLYVACSSSNNVAQYNRSAQLQGTFGGFNAFGALGTMQTPQGLALGGNGDLFVVDQGNNRVSEWQVPQ
jgi:DNA-binding beta-propeller fold protein YncE